MKKSIIFSLLVISFIIYCTPHRPPWSQVAYEGDLVKVKQLILQNNNTIHSKNLYGDTILLWASREGHLELVRLILENGGDINFQNEVTGETALINSSKAGHFEIVKFLIKNGANINAKDNKGNTALLCGCTKGHLDIVKMIREYASSDSKEMNDCLIFASYSGNKELINFLINSYNVNINAFEEHGKTALMVATMSGNSEIIRILLDHGASININDKTRRNALMLSVQAGNLELAELLIQKGADVNNKDYKGISPLMFAAKSGHLRLVELLVDNGADVNAKSINNASPMFLSAFNNEVANYLYKQGAKVYPIKDIEAGFHQYALTYQWLARYYENKFFIDDKKSELDKRYMINNFKIAGELFKKTSSEYTSIADKFRTERVVKVLWVSLANVVSQMAAEYQASLQAKQMAQIDALMSSSGKGKGYGVAVYHTFSADTYDLRKLENLYRKEAVKMNNLSIVCNQLVNCYNRNALKGILKKCLQIVK
jgi:ankyrin repeat protein